MISQVVGDVVKYVLRLTKDGVDYVNKNGVSKTLKDCSDYEGKYVGLIEEIYNFLKENKSIDYIVKYIDAINGKEIKV